MVTTPSPLLFAALAAALTVYIPLPAFRLALFALAAAGFVFSVVWICGRRKAFFRRPDPVFIFTIPALCFGVFCGLWSVSRLSHFTPGVPAENIVSLKGILLDDPRSLSSFTVPELSPETERGISLMELRETGAKLPGGKVRASAGGRVQVFFPAGTMPRLRGFGRGAELYVEGSFLPDDTAAAVPRFRAASVHVVKAAPALEQLRTVVRLSVLNRLKPKTWGGLAAALLLGTRENLEGGLALSFRDAGLSHVLALSGMHLAFLSGLLAFALKRPLGKKGAVLAGLAFIVLYVFLVGPQPSLIRAAIMYVLGSCLVLSGITGQPFVLLGAAFLVQTLWEPASAYSLSFILSYTALGGLLAASGIIAGLLKGLLPDLPANGLGASVGAFLASAPVTAAFFGILRPAGIIAGLIAAPLSGLFMALSLAWLAVGKIRLLGMILDRLLGALQFFLQWSVSLFARLPGIAATLPAVLISAPLIAAGLFVLAIRQKRYRSCLAPFGL
ncbi:MAG: ComEC/Rec2 family competence protein [Spirochaetaceae bacterium]|jgi:competence protein ComEC|nr:ComEC/Rec2 family competence protein [Spirochaetaceae bacterium]